MIYDPLRNGLFSFQFIDSATHIGRCSLDNIFTNDLESINPVGISAPFELRHYVTAVILSKFEINSPQEIFRVVVDWEAADWPKAQVSLIQNPDGSPRELKGIIICAPLSYSPCV